MKKLFYKMFLFIPLIYFVVGIICIFIIEPDLNEPKFCTLEYSELWNSYFYLDDGEAVKISRLDSYDYLVEGMELEIYKHWTGSYRCARDTSEYVIYEDINSRMFVWFLLGIGIVWWIIVKIVMWGQADKKEKTE